MKDRALAPILLESAKKYPVITLTGPRQSGKTTLLKSVFSNYQYVLLEDPETRALITSDPKGFLAQHQKGLIIDEAQRFPELFSYLQVIVDQEKIPGRFILSGSQNFLLLDSITQSLAGRAAIFNLFPFSLSELNERPGISIESLDTKPISPVPGELSNVLYQGFYPRIHDENLPAQEWLGNYIQTYLERDVRSLSNVQDLEQFRVFLGLCAGRNGQLLDAASLGNDVGVSAPTIKRWLSILENSFVITLLRPHWKNFNKRLIKSPKIYFLDSGLLCYLLRIQGPDQIHTHPLKGAIFESFIISELIKRYTHVGKRPPLYFWRDSSGNELDFLLDLGNELIAGEIKSTQTFNPALLKGLQRWRKISGSKRESLLFYGGDANQMIKDTLVASWRTL